MNKKIMQYYFHIMQIIQTSTHEKAYLLDSFLYHWCVGLPVVRLYFCCLVLDARQCLALHSRRHLEAFLLFWTDSYKHNMSVYYPFSIKNTWRYSFQFIFISKKTRCVWIKKRTTPGSPKRDPAHPADRGIPTDRSSGLKWR